jgi:hypothetical protein
VTRRPKVWSSGPTATSRHPSCPGRSFTGPDDFNDQLAGWLVLANRRHHRRIGCAPVDRWPVDVAAMIALPPVAPSVGWRTEVRLPRDHYVRIDANDYSVDPSAVGRKVTVVADLARVTVHLAGRVVGTHERCWARHQTITDPVHRAEALRLAAAAARKPSPPAGTEVEQRNLGDYDAAFGLTEVA